MASQPKLPRLHIPPQGGPQIPPALLTAGLPTAIGPNFPMATPLNPSFGNQIPPRHAMHRAHPSLVFPNPAAFAATMAAQAGVPMTPGAVPGASMLGPQGFQRNRRQQSISLGGPPKAPLGGPNRKHSPMPVTAVTAAATQEKQKTKKTVVKLPVESDRKGDGEASDLKFSLWSRIPLRNAELPVVQEVAAPEIMSMEPHPIELRGAFPATIDVYLPGKAAWDEYFQKLVDERLERLGVDNGGNSAPPGQSHLHGRAASISSPADPALLMFKLNKLQQSQNASLSVSPQPPSSVASVSPGPQVPPRFQQPMGPRHGHSFSLATYNPQQVFTPTGVLSSFIPENIGQSASPVPGIDNYAGQNLPGQLHAPQGVAPVSFNIRSDATASSGPSRTASTIPDFNRGFGLDIPEEEEEELQAWAEQDAAQNTEELEEEGIAEGVEDDTTTAGAHTRHASKASIAMSLHGAVEVQETIEENAPPELENPVEWNIPVGAYSSPRQHQVEGQADPVGEWTATESMEEFSNPSDEERALQARHERRMARQQQEYQADMETPRRLPEFPRPPEGIHQGINETPATDDDIVSNPSDEGRMYGQNEWLHPAGHHPQPVHDYAQYQPVVDGQPRSPRPLPPLPHSRTGSGNISHPASVHHSRHPSHIDPSGIVRRDSLNPFAKPFVFGGSFGSASFAPAAATSDAGSANAHSRQQSVSRPLNAAAAEFKPGFTFVPPPGVPKISFPPPEAPRPLPQPPIGISPARIQGREKRQRRDSEGSSVHTDVQEEEREGRDTIRTFQFPSPVRMPQPQTYTMHHDRPISPMPQRNSVLNAAAQPFAFNPTRLSTSLVAMPEPQPAPAPGEEEEIAEDEEELGEEDMEEYVDEQEGVNEQVGMQEAVDSESNSMPPSPTPAFARKRPPVLDFKHPTSTHTVPAALFRKALMGADFDGNTRAAVRSRLSSREIFEHMNSPSLDDTNVPAISRRAQASASRPGLQPPENAQERMTLVPQGNGSSPVSESKLSDYTRRQEEADQLEQRLEDMLDDRMELAKKDLANAHEQATDFMISQIISAVKAHVSDITNRLEDSTMDARGEVDFELIRNILEHGVMDIRTGLRRDLEEVLRTVEAANASRERSAAGLPTEFQRVMEDFGGRTMTAISNAVVNFAQRVDQIEEITRIRAAEEREGLVNDIFDALLPHIENIRQPAVDFDVITARLAEAVKPHISQLIDLTSDKKETAGLILQRLLPALTSLAQTPAQIDTDAIVAHLRVELANMVPAADPHVLKEAVADLVVERLDSRLAVREKANSGERLYSFISERIDDLHVPVSDVRKAVEELHTGQDSILEQGATLNKLHQDIAAQLLGLPASVEKAIAAINSATEKLESTRTSDAPTSTSDLSQVLPELEAIGSTVRKLATNHEYLASQSATLVTLHETIQKSVTSVPETILEAIKPLKVAQEELLSRNRSADQSNELRNLLTANADLQVQLAKARGAHGQIRVEKDLMSERMSTAEAERDQLRKELTDLKAKNSVKETEVTAAGLRITELEDSLSHALARLESSEVTAKAKEDRIMALEKQNREYGLEQYQLKSQIQRLELQQEWSTRDKEGLESRLTQLQKDRDELASQQSHWKELRRTSEQVDRLTQLIAAADSVEMAELKAASDRAKVLEGEHASLQKRFKEQEQKIANLERAAQSTRSSFAQAQQRISEWERRAKEMEAELEANRARLDEADEIKLQLDSDLSLVKMHLEEKEASEKTSKEREDKLRGDVASLEKQVSSLKAELEKVKTSARAPAPLNTAPSPQPSQWASNGYTNGRDVRPLSRTSTIYGAQSPATPTGATRKDSYAASEAPTSPGGVWASIHAPRYPRRSQPPHRSASPAPSTVSLAPTQGDDGWWS